MHYLCPFISTYSILVTLPDLICFLIIGNSVLRHTSATLLINSGVNIREVSARLGHSNASTTLNIYSHSLVSADKDAADKLEKFIFKSDAKNNKNEI